MLTDVKFNVQKLTDLPAISPLVDKLLDAISDEDISIEKFAALIEQDPSLLGRIIGLANSAYFGQAEPITSAEDAIFKALGLRFAKSLALGIALAGPFHALANVPGFSLHKFWLRAVFTASLVQALCPLVQRPPRPESDEGYLAGMLYDFGLLPLIHLYPQEMARAFKLYEQRLPHARFSDTVREVFGVDHHEVGAWLATRWKIPGRIIRVIQRHPAPRCLPGDDSLTLLVLAVAEWAHSFCCTDEWLNLPDASKALFFELGITAEQFNHVQQETHKKRDLIESFAGLLASV